ncbi:unnamed protein product [[Candida] boidinii]|uniref:Unnamed protein product n=1 Tax=Candida boidinii TaxID=5477 RepID=A0A9W6WLI7_CANBO|nr:unnamed protein product [[Candida] boidinii]
MSSMLEKSLDEIIKDAPRQGGKNFRNNNRPRNGPGGIGKNARSTRGGRFNSHPRHSNSNGRPHHRSGPYHHSSHSSDYRRSHIPKDHEAEELRYVFLTFDTYKLLKYHIYTNKTVFNK